MGAVTRRHLFLMGVAAPFATIAVPYAIAAEAPIAARTKALVALYDELHRQIMADGREILRLEALLAKYSGDVRPEGAFLVDPPVTV